MKRSNILEKKFIRLWYAEASMYNFSINLSLGFANAYMIKIMGYGLSELGLLVAIRIFAIALSQLPATIIIMGLRDKRKFIWLIAGGVNRIGWSLVPLAFLMPRPIDMVFLSAVSFLAQFTGGVAGIAAMDTVGDNIPDFRATEVFSMINKLSYFSVLISQIIGIVLFIMPLDTFTAYIIIYLIALISGIASIILLYYIPDQNLNVEKKNVMKQLGNVKGIIENTKLRRYLLIISLFYFSVNIPAPFWDYIVLGVSGGLDILIPFKNISALGIKAFVVNWWQKLAIKQGLKKVLVEGMAFTSLVPVLYAEASSAVEIVIAEAVSGFVWTPIDVGTTVYNIYLPSRDVRPLYLSAINLIVNGVSTVAASVGTTMVVMTRDVHTALLTSAILRVITASLAYRILPDMNEHVSKK